jgi:hypothetical protein
MRRMRSRMMLPSASGLDVVAQRRLRRRARRRAEQYEYRLVALSIWRGLVVDAAVRGAAGGQHDGREGAEAIATLDPTPIALAAVDRDHFGAWPWR